MTIPSTASRFLGLPLDTGIAIIAAAAAALTLFFGEGILFGLLNLINRGYRWEVKPVRDPNTHVVQARVSHGHDGNRVLTKALVAVVQRPLLRVLWRLFHRRGIERWIVAADLLDGQPVREPVLPQYEGITLQGYLLPSVPLPTWKFWRRNRSMQDPTRRKLILILKFDRRRRLISKPVKVASGSMEPLTGKSAEQAVPAAPGPSSS
jgi:hypothetical protein